MKKIKKIYDALLVLVPNRHNNINRWFGLRYEFANHHWKTN